MDSNKKVEYLVTDTSAFIRNVALQEIGNNVITEPAVVNEITSKRQLNRLVVLPYDLKIQEAFPENIKFVTEFAKKTGDYTSLSATDIKVIALTYQLEKEKVGTEHLRSAPKIVKTINSETPENLSYQKVAGFYLPHNSNDNKTKRMSAKDAEVERLLTTLKTTGKLVFEDDVFPETKYDETKSLCVDSDSCSESNYDTAPSDVEWSDAEDLPEKFQNLNCKKTEISEDHNIDDITHPVNDKDLNVEDSLQPSYDKDLNIDDNRHLPNDEDLNVDDLLQPVNDEGVQWNSEDEIEESDEENDDAGWITPKNLVSVKKQMDSDIMEEKPMVVACLTTDFAMQNVLKQIGLNISSLDGKVIKQMRTFIFRCYACFKTTSIMTKVFCPNCGYKTLKKVAISVDEEGKQHMHINFKKPLSKKGTKFSLPTPRGGKHAKNPILCEDQPMPDQRPSRLARTKNDPLKDEYISGYSPFVMRDVNSRSALLGIRPGTEMKYWMQRNPNESRRRRK